MPTFYYSSPAEADHYELIEYIARDNVEAAIRVEAAIESPAQSLSDNPDIASCEIAISSSAGILCAAIQRLHLVFPSGGRRDLYPAAARSQFLYVVALWG